MTVGVAIGVALIGGLGAVLRLLLDGAVSARVRGAFPWGTLAVNLTGAFALGLVAGASSGTSSTAYRLLGTGLIGAFTTFSTWMFETQRLAEDGDERLGLGNLAISLVAGLALAYLGDRIGAHL